MVNSVNTDWIVIKYNVNRWIDNPASMVLNKTNHAAFTSKCPYTSHHPSPGFAMAIKNLKIQVRSNKEKMTYHATQRLYCRNYS